MGNGEFKVLNGLLVIVFSTGRLEVNVITACIPGCNWIKRVVLFMAQPSERFDWSLRKAELHKSILK
jgi:hypothetical protein